MFITGRGTWRVAIDEPAALRLALYVRDIEDLPVEQDPPIPPLEPGPSRWPVWARRPARPAAALDRTADIDRVAAADQWARWWRHLLARPETTVAELGAPVFPAFAALPELRRLLRHHYETAVAWSDGVADDPRTKRDHLAAGSRLTEVVDDLEREQGRPARQFELRITVIAVHTKHAWVLGPDHVLISHQLIADDDSTVDWLRLRIRNLI